jgi:Fe-S-cluster containining protein
MPLDLLETIERAGDDGHRPKPQKIRPMWLSSCIRWPIRVFALGFVLLDSWAQRIAKFFIRPPFKQIGSCKKRGNCCHYIMVAKVSGPLGFLDQFWHTQINGFYLRSKEPVVYDGKKMLVMGCRYLKNNKCSIYWARPAVCRNWPRIEVFGKPQRLKGCGFKPAISNVKTHFKS